MLGATLVGMTASFFGLFSAENAHVIGIPRDIDEGFWDSLWWSLHQVIRLRAFEQMYGASGPILAYATFLSLMGLAVFGVPAPAGVATAAAPGDTNRHPVTFPDTGVGARRGHRTTPLVPADGRVVVTARLIGVQVGTADSTICDLHNRFPRRRFRLGKFPQFDLSAAGNQSCQHDRDPLVQYVPVR